MNLEDIKAQYKIHYKNLFLGTNNHETLAKSVIEQDNIMLNPIPSHIEVRKAMFSINPPGPDGFS